MPQNSPSQRRRKSQTPSPTANGPTRSNPLARRPGQRPSEAQPAPAHSQHRSQTSPPSRTRRKPPVRRRRRFHLPPLLAVLIALVLLPPLLALGINFWMFLTTTGNMATPEELTDQNADCIVVLGAGIEPDGTPSPILARPNRSSSAAGKMPPKAKSQPCATICLTQVSLPWPSSPIPMASTLLPVSATFRISTMSRTRSL